MFANSKLKREKCDYPRISHHHHHRHLNWSLVWDLLALLAGNHLTVLVWHRHREPRALLPENRRRIEALNNSVLRNRSRRHFLGSRHRSFFFFLKALLRIILQLYCCQFEFLRRQFCLAKICVNFFKLPVTI